MRRIIKRQYAIQQSRQIKKYELILEAVGEAEWPFGSASGRLILKEGKNKIS